MAYKNLFEQTIPKISITSPKLISGDKLEMDKPQTYGGHVFIIPPLPWW